MNEIKVTVELSEKAENLLTAILHELCRLPGGEITIHDERPQAQEVEAITEPAQIAEEAPGVETVPAKPETPENEPGATKDDVRKLFVNLAAAGKKDQAREIVTAHAPSITELPDGVVSQVYAKLKALEG